MIGHGAIANRCPLDDGVRVLGSRPYAAPTFISHRIPRDRHDSLKALGAWVNGLAGWHDAGLGYL